MHEGKKTSTRIRLTMRKYFKCLEFHDGTISFAMVLCVALFLSFELLFYQFTRCHAKEFRQSIRLCMQTTEEKTTGKLISTHQAILDSSHFFSLCSIHNFVLAICWIVPLGKEGTHESECTHPHNRNMGIPMRSIACELFAGIP